MARVPVRGLCVAAAALLLVSCGTTAAEKAAEAEAARIAGRIMAAAIADSGRR